MIRVIKYYLNVRNLNLTSIAIGFMFKQVRILLVVKKKKGKLVSFKKKGSKGSNGYKAFNSVK